MPPKIEKSDEEWRAELSDQEYEVCRRKGTERAFTGKYCDCKEPGDQEAIITTAVVLMGPALLLGAGVVFAFAEPVSRLLIGAEGSSELLRLVLVTGVVWGARPSRLARTRT